MATVSFTLSASHALRLEGAICGLYSYQSTIDGQANPESRADFAKRMIGNLLKRQVYAWERRQAIESAMTGITEITMT